MLLLEFLIRAIGVYLGFMALYCLLLLPVMLLAGVSAIGPISVGVSILSIVAGVTTSLVTLGGQRHMPWAEKAVKLFARKPKSKKKTLDELMAESEQLEARIKSMTK